MLTVFSPDSGSSAEQSSSLPTWLNQLLHSNLKALDERSAAVLQMRYGIGGGDPMSLSDVAGRLGEDDSSIRNVEQRALQLLQQALARNTYHRINAIHGAPTPLDVRC
jgi:DNA-directed RNA polymerase sigma subunit (sigma70/sigma32)